MTVDHRTRRQLHERLEEVLGVAEAEALMDYLPPVGWADVATKTDLTGLESRIEERMDRMTAELTAALRGEIITAITTQNRQTLFAVIGAMLALAGLAGLK